MQQKSMVTRSMEPVMENSTLTRTHSFKGYV